MIRRTADWGVVGISMGGVHEMVLRRCQGLALILECDCVTLGLLGLVMTWASDST